jgi:predicted Zn-dependent peptidase
MTTKLNKRLELRTTQSDLELWAVTARAAGFRSVAEWIRQKLNETPDEHIGESKAPRGRPCAGESRGDSSIYKKTTLENGIRVITESMTGVRSISIGVLVDCGSRDERAEESGLAHLCEHMLFQGTSSRDELRIGRQIDSAGGHVGGFTTRDYTCYHASVLDDYCYHALELLGDVLLNPTFPEESLEREKQTILREIEGNHDVPSYVAHENMKAAAWPNDPLGRPIAGHPDILKRHTREDLIYFMHRNYTPNRIVIAAAGSLDHEDFVAKVRDSFWRMLGDNDPTPSLKPQFHPGFHVQEIASHQAYFSLAVEAFPYVHQNRYTLHVLNQILGGGISSRLFRRLREESGLIYDVHSDYHAYREAGMVVVEGATAPASLTEALEGVLGALHGLAAWSEPVDAEELWRAKTQIKAQHHISSEDVHTRMCRLATQELYFGRSIASGRIVEDIEAVDINSVRRLARSDLGPNLPAICLSVAGPEQPLSERNRQRQILSDFRAGRWPVSRAMAAAVA